ncbi:MAG TPA: hypothetical protein VLQ67_07535 [Arachnia sp.]|nr:hypothetical protein [Arachnia sp.]
MGGLHHRIVGSLREIWSEPGARTDAEVPHRRLQHLTEAACYWMLLEGRVDDAAIGVVLECLDSLSRQQDEDTGLFVVGDNVLSPPDTSFSINGLTRLALVLRARGASGLPWDEVRRRLDNITASVAEALRTGGVHTPNHRWEIASALARCGAVLGDSALTARAEQWLAEGIDIQNDGLYSERSPNYAAYVSNPSLTVLASLLDRPALLDAVHTNLHAQALLTGDDATVLTLQSRRQDQGRVFGVAPFEFGYLTTAGVFSCGLCASMAQRCANSGGGDPVEIAAGILDGALVEATTPAAQVVRPEGWHHLTASELALYVGEDEELVVRAASDVAAVGRVCSGVNHEPTFASYRREGLHIAGMRLSRAFFGLGPFRADTLERHADRVTLTEIVSAGYYQPLGAADHRGDGSYDLEFDGRFAASMSFSRRDVDVVQLATTVTVERLPDGLRVAVACVGPAVPLSLELALGPGSVEVTGAQATAEPELWAALGPVEVRTHDGVAWSVEPASDSLSSAAFYEPGEAVRYARGSDAVIGPRLAVSWRSDAQLELNIRRVGDESHPPVTW